MHSLVGILFDFTTLADLREVAACGAAPVLGFLVQLQLRYAVFAVLVALAGVAVRGPLGRVEAWRCCFRARPISHDPAFLEVQEQQPATRAGVIIAHMLALQAAPVVFRPAEGYGQDDFAPTPLAKVAGATQSSEWLS